VAVVRRDEGDAGPPGQCDERFVDRRLVGQAVVLELQVEIAVAEDLHVAAGGGFGSGLVAGHDARGDLPGQAGGQADQAAGVPAEQLEVDAGAVVEPLQEAQGDQSAQVLIAVPVLHQQDEVEAVLAGAGFLVPAARDDVHLAADNGFDAGLLRLLVELHGAVQVAVVGDGQGRHSAGGGLGHQPVDGAGAVEQRVVGVHMQMDERLAHGICDSAGCLSPR